MFEFKKPVTRTQIRVKQQPNATAAQQASLATPPSTGPHDASDNSVGVEEEPSSASHQYAPFTEKRKRQDTMYDDEEMITACAKVRTALFLSEHPLGKRLRLEEEESRDDQSRHDVEGKLHDTAMDALRKRKQKLERWDPAAIRKLRDDAMEATLDEALKNLKDIAQERRKRRKMEEMWQMEEDRIHGEIEQAQRKLEATMAEVFREVGLHSTRKTSELIANLEKHLSNQRDVSDLFVADHARCPSPASVHVDGALDDIPHCPSDRRTCSSQTSSPSPQMIEEDRELAPDAMQKMKMLRSNKKKLLLTKLVCDNGDWLDNPYFPVSKSLRAEGDCTTGSQKSSLTERQADSIGQGNRYWRRDMLKSVKSQLMSLHERYPDVPVCTYSLVVTERSTSSILELLESLYLQLSQDLQEGVTSIVDRKANMIAIYSAAVSHDTAPEIIINSELTMTSGISESSDGTRQYEELKKVLMALPGNNEETDRRPVGGRLRSRVPRRHAPNVQSCGRGRGVGMKK